MGFLAVNYHDEGLLKIKGQDSSDGLEHMNHNHGGGGSSPSPDTKSEPIAQLDSATVF